MDSSFFQSQMDYIFFVYGLAFVMLGAVCFAIRQKVDPLPWQWLGLFGLVNGVNKWLDMLALSLGDGDLFAAVRLCMLLLSFVFLVEFGRSGWISLHGRGPGRWIHLPLLACVALGFLFGAGGSGASCRYAPGLAGGLWSALVLASAARQVPSCRQPLRVGALAMAGYAVAVALAVLKGAPPKPFFLDYLVYQESFLKSAHFPIQLARAGLAALLAAAIWEYHLRHRFSIARLMGHATSRLDTFLGFQQGSASSYGRRFAMIIAVVLAIAWVAIQQVGLNASVNVKEEIRQKAQIGAETLDARRFQSLRGVPEDASQPDYLWLRQRLLPLSNVSPDIRLFYTMFLRNGKVIFVADSLSLNDKLHAEPGMEYLEPPSALLQLFSDGQSVTAGPYKDEWGAFVSGFAAIRDPDTHQVIAALGIDIDAAYWYKTIARHRLVPILISLLITMLLVMFFIIRQRMLESAQKIEANEQRLVEAQEIAHIGNWTFDRQSGVFSWSEEMARICGCNPQRPAVYEEFLERLALEDRGVVEDALYQAGTEGTAIDLQVRVVRPGGIVRHAIFRGQAKYNDQGEIFQLNGMLQDVTERHRMEEALREDEARLRTIMNAIQTGTVIIDPATHRIVEVNPMACEMIGTTRDKIIGAVCHKFICPADVGACPITDRGGTVDHAERMLLTADGHRRDILKTVTSVVLDGRPHLLESMIDITDRKRMEEELRQHKEILEDLVVRRTQDLVGALRRAETANHAKTAFLANMSHELRTPLNAVLGFAQTMQRDPVLAAQHKDNLAIILASGEHLLRLINDVLDITRLEAGHVNLDLQDVILKSLLDEIVEPMQVRAAAKGLEFATDLAPEVPDHLRTDPDKFRQILTSLIENAIKFTPAGKVSVQIGATPMESGAMLTIEVRDTGIGIAGSDLERLFHPFEQVSQKALNEGTGVGLAITRSLVELLGGKISAISELGQGSVFRIAIPTGLAGPAVVAATAPESPSAAAPLRVLVTADFQSLPSETLKTLYRLSIQADYYDLCNWLASQNQLAPEAKEAMAALLSEYRFDTIQSLLEPLVKPG